MTDRGLVLPRLLAVLVVGFGMLAIFATYWDEAWHTDIGRDSAWAAPHVLLYASVGVVGLSVAAWGLRVLNATGSLRGALAYTPLLAAGFGGVGALIAAPIDAYWHESYGRDAVLWSPPHMLVVFASTALALGVLAGLPESSTWLRILTGALLTANAAAVVFEYEADVPQFNEALYLPVLLLGGLLVVFTVRRSVPGRLPVSRVVLTYALLRLAIMAGLAALGRSTPDLPLAVLGLAGADLPFRSELRRYAAAVVATSAIAIVASASGLASPSAGSVALAAVPLAAAALIIAMSGPRLRQVAAVAVLISGLAVTVSRPAPAQAHDPGQGDKVATVTMGVDSDGSGSLAVTARIEGGCGDLREGRLVARRAGAVVSEGLTAGNDCAFTGVVDVPPHGRWFVYITFNDEAGPVEAWLPIDTSDAGAISKERDLYSASASSAGTSLGQVMAGGLIYLLGIGLLGLGLAASARSRRTSVG